MKNMTIRLIDSLADDLERISRVTDTPVSDIIRAAISSHVEKITSLSDFKERLAKSIERDKEVLRRL